MSRRLSIILGSLIIGVAWIGQALVPAFLAIAAFEILRGLGEAFASGACEAWVSNEVGDDRVQDLFLRAEQLGRVTFIVGLVASVPLASAAIAVPIVVGGALKLVTSLLFVAVMPEKPFPRATTARSWAALGSTAREGARVVRGRPLLVTILLVELCLGAASEGYDRLSAPYLLRDIEFPTLWRLDAVAWLALINVSSVVLTIGAIALVRRRLRDASHSLIARFLFAAQTLRVGSRILFAFAPGFAFAAVGLGGDALAAASRPIYGAWLTRSVDQSVRATVVSMASLTNAAGQMGGGPIVGAIGSLASIPAALATSVIFLLPSLFLFARAEHQAPDRGRWCGNRPRLSPRTLSRPRPPPCQRA